VDECLDEGDGNNCNLQATCENDIGSFTCTCNTGYNGDGIDCFGILSCYLLYHIFSQR